jgi:two-component system cell cycle sensor histidine kinase/response regulator CckA
MRRFALKNWYSQSAIENEDDRRMARVLIRLIMASWGVYVFACFVSWYYGDWKTICVMGAAILLQVLPLWLIRSGHLPTSALIFVVGVIVAVTGMATFGQGIQDIGVIAYPIALVFAGLTVSRLLFGSCVVLTLLAVSWLALGEAYGAFVTKPVNASKPIYLMGVIVVLLVAALAVHMLSTTLRSSLSYARRELEQRKQAEVALQESEERFRDLSSMTSEGIMIHEGGIVVDANRAFADLIGCPDPSDLLGKNSLELIPLTAESPRLVQGRTHLSSTETYEIELVGSGGSVRFVETSARKVTYRGREARLVSMRDITERKRAEEALRMAEDQLRQSQKMEAVGQLAGGIAHDFNNLLSAILGYTDLVLADPGLSDSPARQDLEEVKHAAQRAATLTKQILAFSRRQALRPRVVSLNDVLDRMEPLLCRLLGEDVEFRSITAPDLGTVEADVHQFEQVVMNLAVNARDAMPSGGRLTVETTNVELDEEFCRTHAGAIPGSHVALRVSDTGVGMDELTQAHVFEPFFTTKAAGAGSGLGLAVAYGIVKQSNGSIFMDSEPGKGTTFTIYLPRVTASVEQEVPVADSAAEGRGTETILLVEDEISVRNLVARVLRDLAEARQVAGQADTRIDLLLTDVVLPGDVQGNELARDILSCRPDLPVLYVSGYARDALLHSNRLDQAVNLLEKPFTPEALAIMVRTLLDQQHTAD